MEKFISFSAPDWKRYESLRFLRPDPLFSELIRSKVNFCENNDFPQKDRKEQFAAPKREPKTLCYSLLFAPGPEKC